MWIQNEITWRQHEIKGVRERVAVLVPFHVTPPDLAVPPHRFHEEAEEEVEEDCRSLKYYIDHEIEALGRHMENEFRQLWNVVVEIRCKLSTATASSSTPAAAVADPQLSQLG